MHRIATVGIGLLLGCSMTEHCSAAAAVKPDADRPPAVTASPDELKLAESANAGFAVDLYRQLATEHPGENLFFSPFSVSSALLIAAEGASGQTAEQMGNVLHVPNSLRNTGANAASIPWQLGPLDKGQAAMTYRLSPAPASPELRTKIDQLKRDLDAANQQTVSLERTEKWQEAQKSHAAAAKLAAELNPLLKADRALRMAGGQRALDGEDISLPPDVSRHDPRSLRRRAEAGRFSRSCRGGPRRDQLMGLPADARSDQGPHAPWLDRFGDAAGHHERRLFQGGMARSVR